MAADTSRSFIAAMHAQSAGPASALAAMPLFNDVRRLLDAAGGSGVFALRLAERYPRLEARILELPVTAPLTREYVGRSPAAPRVQVIEGDAFREAWPTGHDTVLLSNVLHDWDMEKCAALLRRAFDSLPSGGQLVIHEMVLGPARSGPLAVLCFSMAMLVQTEGKQYTRAELDSLLGQAGFDNVQIQPSLGYFSLLSARKP
jgi:acetylserotonin N-methyltransferase